VRSAQKQTRSAGGARKPAVTRRERQTPPLRQLEIGRVVGTDAVTFGKGDKNLWRDRLALHGEIEACSAA